jgi:hypothetical protein
MTKSVPLRITDVFVPGRLPEYTYNPRAGEKLEVKLQDYLDELGKILTIAGPTKTGKTVLLENQLSDKDPIWIQGQGLDSVDKMWGRVVDLLNLRTTNGGSRVVSDRHTTSGGGGIGFGGSGIHGDVAEETGEDVEANWSSTRPLDVAASEQLKLVKRPLVLDDFHFIERAVQIEIIRALKPLAFSGVPIVFVSIGHRVRDLMTAEPDMGGRLYNVDVGFWSPVELEFIASAGFDVLNFSDPGGALAKRLAEQSFGSPHLMQQFCRELCKENDLREQSSNRAVLKAPASWEHFFASQLDGAATNWARRLATGPQEHGKPRTKYTLKDKREVDGYELILASIAESGPKLELSKADITHGIDALVVGASPSSAVTTQKLQHMSRIAATRLNESVPSEEELSEEESSETDPYVGPDLQPVLEYIEDGPNSRLHIADPFFAFYLAWGINQLLPEPMRA